MHNMWIRHSYKLAQVDMEVVSLCWTHIQASRAYHIAGIFLQVKHFMKMPYLL